MIAGLGLNSPSFRIFPGRKPVSSRSSRAAASSGFSPGSKTPPGNSRLNSREPCRHCHTMTNSLPRGVCKTGIIMAQSAASITEKVPSVSRGICNSFHSPKTPGSQTPFSGFLLSMQVRFQPENQLAIFSAFSFTCVWLMSASKTRPIIS